MTVLLKSGPSDARRRSCQDYGLLSIDNNYGVERHPLFLENPTWFLQVSIISSWPISFPYLQKCPNRSLDLYYVFWNHCLGSVLLYDIYLDHDLCYCFHVWVLYLLDLGISNVWWIVRIIEFFILIIWTLNHMIIWLTWQYYWLFELISMS